MKSTDKPIKKASNNPLKEAKGHPDGPGLTEILNGKEEKGLDKRKTRTNQEPDGGPIPVI